MSMTDKDFERWARKAGLDVSYQRGAYARMRTLYAWRGWLWREAEMQSTQVKPNDEIIERVAIAEILEGNGYVGATEPTQRDLDIATAGISKYRELVGNIPRQPALPSEDEALAVMKEAFGKSLYGNRHLITYSEGQAIKAAYRALIAAMGGS